MARYIVVSILLLIIAAVGIFLWQSDYSSNLHREVHNLDSNINEAENSSKDISNASNSFIEQLRNRKFEGSQIKVERELAQNDRFTTFLISYQSDNLKINGMMKIPKGNGPFPVIILNHGYYNPRTFQSGNGTETMGDILASRGYITLASDYRGHGKSEGEPGGHDPNYSIDVLNLLASIKSIKQANQQNIGMWGHSMGGEVSLRTIEATDQVKAVVLWAPTSGNASDNHAFYGGKNSQESSPDTEGISPINYLKYITAPISIHQGLEDTEVNPKWSKELKNELEKNGKKVEYFEYQGQDHNFRNLGWDEISQRTISFYNNYLK